MAAGSGHGPPPSQSLITPHAQRERGKVIDRGVHMSVVEKNI